ncbi:MAG: DUF4169 family protein [Caulobacteraceae bacterium]
MSDNVVNLNKARKDREKAARAVKAQENRARFGLTKGEKTKAMSIAEKLKQALDAARRDDGPKA